MGAPYSLDLRERVVAAVAGGLSRQAAAERFDISLSSTNRWMQRAAATGSPAALPMGGKKPFSLAEQADWINARIVEKPDITGRALLAELHGRKLDVSYFAVWNFLDHAGLSFKKPCTPMNRTVTMLPGDARYGSSCRARLLLLG